MNAPALIQGTDLVTDHFASWPSFHDAEVTTFSMSRESGDGLSGPTLSFAVHAFLTTSDLDASGCYQTTKHAVITFSFFDVTLVEFADFNGQNVVADIYFGPGANGVDDDQPLDVAIAPCYGVALHFRCRGGRVMSVAPGTPPGSQYASR